jgi:leucyl aminopeptidase
MQVQVQAVAPTEVEADTLAVPLIEEGLSESAKAVDGALDGLLQQLNDEGELRSELGYATIVHVRGKLPAKRIAVAGLGRRDGIDADAVRTAGAAVALEAGQFTSSLAWTLDSSLPLPVDEQASALVEGTLLGAYDPGRWKHDEDHKPKLSSLVLCGDTAVSEGVERAATISEWVNRARDLVNLPPNEGTPERLAERAAEIASQVANVKADALDREQITKQGMGAFAAVAQGSDTEPRLVVLRYEPPEAKSDIVLGLVGKAITFDTGGISLKPSLHMQDMKGDMAGGAACIEATGAIADLGLPIRVLTVVAACENMPGGHAYRPGDILTAANGKTIEVTNTDAEGRLVLADALWYARENGATHVLDLATLTGAMELAMGDLYAGIFANEDEWRNQIVEAGEASGDHAWPWPMHPRYRRYVDSAFADLKNSSDLRQASPALAAEFLKEFAGEGPWAHADIAGPAFLERPRGDYLSQRGGTGYGVRLIVELASRLSA